MKSRFSLTLTLSRWEREQVACASIIPKAARLNPNSGQRAKLGAFLPLPQGEGRGEGERSN